MDRMDRWKARLFDLTLFVLFLIALAKLLYYEIFK